MSAERGISAVRIPLLAVRRCPVCGTIGTYDARESNAPHGWIHIAYGGADEYVCTTSCMEQLIAFQNLRKKALNVSKETGDLVRLKDVE